MTSIRLVFKIRANNTIDIQQKLEGKIDLVLYYKNETKLSYYIYIHLFLN